MFCWCKNWCKNVKRCGDTKNVSGEGSEQLAEFCIRFVHTICKHTGWEILHASLSFKSWLEVYLFSLLSSLQIICCYDVCISFINWQIVTFHIFLTIFLINIITRVKKQNRNIKKCLETLWIFVKENLFATQTDTTNR